ncbi:MAG: DUF2591 family protein [FCB group bacterium]|jgi:hypothetical protein|nr:DUF2591 family protein [FCB group bacterium]
MKIKTSELTGAALDWTVCKAEGDELAARNIEYPKQAKHYPKVAPSTDWSLAGPIIEREGIDVRLDRDRVFDPGEKVERWYASKPFDTIPDSEWVEYGATPLIAAMRCFVASKLGDEVEIPNELLTPQKPRGIK